MHTDSKGRDERTKFVFDDDELLPVLLCQDAVDQGGLAGSEEACDDGHRSLDGRHDLHSL